MMMMMMKVTSNCSHMSTLTFRYRTYSLSCRAGFVRYSERCLSSFVSSLNSCLQKFKKKTTQFCLKVSKPDANAAKYHRNYSCNIKPLTAQKSRTCSFSSTSLASGLLSRNLTYISNLGFYKNHITFSCTFFSKEKQRQTKI